MLNRQKLEFSFRECGKIKYVYIIIQYFSISKYKELNEYKANHVNSRTVDYQTVFTVDYQKLSLKYLLLQAKKFQLQKFPNKNLFKKHN